jgi:hypothetical protein
MVSLPGHFTVVRVELEAVWAAKPVSAFSGREMSVTQPRIELGSTSP